MRGLGRRLAAELRRAPSPAEIAAARARAEPRLQSDVVTLEDGVYASIPTRAARVDVLERARALGPREIVLHVAVGDLGSHRGRLVLDAPRRLLGALGIASLPAPGDRFVEGRFVHCFFDEEPLLCEFADAGLVVRSVSAGAYCLVPGVAAREQPDSVASELARAAALVADAERRRRRDTPAVAVRAMRERGGRAPTRGPIGRARLRRAIGWVDAALPGGENCYRRVLLELGLDAGAARETLVFGLDVGRTGHVAFAGREDARMQRFDVVYELGPD